jgi:hypothetical protein
MLIVKVLAIILGFKVIMAIMDLIDIKLEDRKKGKRKNEGRFETFDDDVDDEEDDDDEDYRKEKDGYIYDAEEYERKKARMKKKRYKKKS